MHVFVFIRNNGEIHRYKHFSEFRIFDQIKVSDYRCKSDIARWADFW